MAPDVTVVVTTRDRPELAARAIGSALAQTVARLEVVVVDDGSLVPFQIDPGPEDIRILRHEESRGVCAARNTGLRAARGRWVTFLDDDDQLLPNMVELSLAAIETSSLPPPISVLSGIEVVDEFGEVLETRRPVSLPSGSHYFLEDADDGSFQTHNTLLVERSLLVEIGGWDEDLLSSEHDDLFLRINQVSSIEGIVDVTYRHRSGAPTRLSKDLRARAEAMARTVAKHRDAFSQHRRHHARYLRAMGITFLRGGRWIPAVAGTTRSLLVNPRSIEGWKWWLVSLLGPLGLSVYRAMSRPARMVGDSGGGHRA